MAFSRYGIFRISVKRVWIASSVIAWVAWGAWGASPSPESGGRGRFGASTHSNARIGRRTGRDDIALVRVPQI